MIKDRSALRGPRSLSFAAHLKALRGDNTQQDLADLIGHGLSVRTLQAWESGRQEPAPLFCRLVISHVQWEIETFEGLTRFRTWRQWLDSRSGHRRAAA